MSSQTAQVVYKDEMKSSESCVQSNLMTKSNFNDPSVSHKFTSNGFDTFDINQ